MPQNDHNSKNHTAYEAAIKTLVFHKLEDLSAKQAEQVNWYINCLLEAGNKEKIESEQGYGDWTEDELRLMSLYSMERAYKDE